MEGGEQNQGSTQSSEQNQVTTQNETTGSDLGWDFERVRSGDRVCKSENPNRGDSFEIKGGRAGSWITEDK
ncbi:hypothetical protein [Parafilimonas sp.]|uniref:hypothetical protein n=1 Tax=Parafilimonas sp. TaxID=1969739 RepID=UPI0039E58155